jgi:two-component system cell cycle sensor histidine kinase/response regulator CckA
MKSNSTYLTNHKTPRPLVEDVLNEHRQLIYVRTDRMFAVLMTLQWVAGIAAAYWISPRTWIGADSHLHPHIWAAVLLGGAISSLPITLALMQPGRFSTRYIIAVGQMLMGALLIHLTGGRIETHFHVFGSLAFLAFYRDWRVLVPATLVVAADHFLRGLLWPQSVYGVLVASEWRWLEHAGWVFFEDTFLFIAIKYSVDEMRNIAERTVEIKSLNEGLERHVAERTAELIVANRDLTNEVTERKRAEEFSRESEERYRRLFDSNPLPMWLFDRETHAFLAVNEAAVRHYGYSRDEFLGMTTEDLRSPDDIPPQRDGAARVTGGLGQTDLCRYRKKDGTIIDVEVTAHALIFAGGKSELVLANDITERRQTEAALAETEEQLRRAQRLEAVGNLAGGIAHDFNNLLTVITGYTGLMLRRMEDEDPYREKIVGIKKAADRAASLTQQLLAFSRKQVLQPKVLDLAALVPETSTMLRRLIGEDVDLALSLKPGLGRIKADPNQIEQVIMNLVINARDAMPLGGKITIEASNVILSERYADLHLQVKAGPYVMLAVSDTGSGMDAETQKRIFEPFFTTKDVGKGTGLGLATVYGIVKQSGGNIWVYSEVGRGTTFKVYFPEIQTATTVHRGTGPLDQIPRGTETILLVEDEEMVRQMTRAILEDSGYEVLEASCGDDALRICEQHDRMIDLVITDVVMPGMSGRELAERVALVRPGLRLIYMSGYTDDAIVHHGVIDNGMPFLEKPFTPETIGQKIREVLGNTTGTAN